MNLRAATFLTASCSLAALLLYPGDAAAGFIASDFSLSVEAEDQYFEPGAVVIFDAILTNQSSQSASFGSNIALAGASTEPRINGQFVLAFPFIEGYHAELFSDQGILLPPGDSLRFPFLFIDTGPTTPLGTFITSGPGNIAFRNIPRSTSDPFIDFFVPLSNIATATAPEPATGPLTALGVLALLFRVRPRRHCGRRTHAVGSVGAGAFVQSRVSRCGKEP